ncbi:MAG: DUF4922 domain-containing protein [Bacteroidales bacterium]|nr:DUF4922 domain-containing protein [Bacteroidales bacterium]
MSAVIKKGLDCFVLYSDAESTLITLKQLKEESLVNRIYVLMRGEEECPFMGCDVMRIGDMNESATVRKVAAAVEAPYALICFEPVKVKFGYQAIKRMVSVAESVAPAAVYADRYVIKNGQRVASPTMDFYYGSVRDDFDFGPVCLFSSPTIKKYVEDCPAAEYKYAGWYDVHLYFLRRKRLESLFHIREYLYTEEAVDLRESGEKQFDYVDPRNREVQLEKEEIFTDHLKQIGAYIEPESIVEVSVEKHLFDKEATVIIPVRNRVKTIEDAVKSALMQRTSFEFNVMVVDNHSSDGTSDVVAKLAETDSRVQHIIPNRDDLGIGGCWALAFNDKRCGRFAVQLDSDDLYSSPDTLQKIVDKFYEEHCGMVIGSYRMCNFQLETLPPGLIDHREWTAENGHNNALRVNGLGAPRAFYTPLLRKIGMPNTSYGEDYAVGLSFCRKYKIGRIYEELYLCRRWEGNSDAALSPEQVNKNNIYKDSIRTMEIVDRCRLNDYWQEGIANEQVCQLFDTQLKTWALAREHYEQLSSAVVETFATDECDVDVQFNPARIVSTSAKVDPETLKRRPCFLCEVNRPEEQSSLPMLKKYHLLLNPNPILPKHFTIPLRHHHDQQILDYYEDMMEMAVRLKDMLLFYNGPKCGASAPDHMHFQAGSRGVVPLERDWLERYQPVRSRVWPISENEYLEALQLEDFADSTGIFSLRDYLCPGFVVITRTPHANKVLFDKLYASLPVVEGHSEPMMNILAWVQSSSYDGSQRIVSVIIPRSKHRPDCYFKEGTENMMVSPGALDMAGLLVVPREEDFQRMDADTAKAIIQECGISRDEELAAVMKFKMGGGSISCR